MKIAILDDYTDTVRTTPAFARLREHEVTVWTDLAPDLEILAERLKDREAIILIRERMQLGDALLSRLPRLKMISHFGIHPNVDVDACTRNGVLFCDGRGHQQQFTRSAASTAELTWALILAAMRKLPHNIASLKAGKWQHSTGRTLFDKTLGVYGYAETGRRVAAFGRAFGMDVQVWGRGGSQERAAIDGFRAADSREDFFATSDVLSLHMRLAPETTGLVTTEDLARMKPDSVLVNTSRASLVQPGALEAALQAGRPAMAAVDVFETEPVRGNLSLLCMDNAICTPHIGYATQEQLEDIFEILVDGILAYARGEPTGAVNSARIVRKEER